MIGIDRKTGKRIDGFEQFVSRVTQVMTTPLTARAKRPKFGSKVRSVLGANMTDGMLIRAQALAIEAFYNSENGLSDFQVSRCEASRKQNSISLVFSGKWQGRPVSPFEVFIHVSTSKSTT